ncbi:MAG: magnesium/cobalt transporter CorA [Actinomycetota bacterium]|nr:magnesium/cobalt transporter CorA [Actinomycetota bacterium]
MQEQTHLHAESAIDCGLYTDGRRRAAPTGDSCAQSLARARSTPGSFVWIGLVEPTALELDGLAAEFGLHPLAVEDAVHAHQRPKVETYGDTVFVVLKTARYLDAESRGSSRETADVIETGEVMLFLGPQFVVTVRHGPGSLAPVRARLDNEPDLLRCGPWAVLYGVADSVVDDYLAVAANFEYDVDEVEAEVFAPGRSADVAKVYALKRELLAFRRAVLPLGRPMDRLAAGQVIQVPAGVVEYLGDVHDHLQRVAEHIESYDELLNGILQANLAQVSLQQNNDMRKISAWAAILAVPTAIAGVYGMNFEHMPELGWRYGYPMVVLVMLSVCAVLYASFRRNDWL